MVTDEQVVDVINKICKMLEPIKDRFDIEKPSDLTSDERAREFVNRYPNLFTEDKDFWINTLGDYLEEEWELNKKHFEKCFYRSFDMEEAFRAGGNKDHEEFEKFINNYD